MGAIADAISYADSLPEKDPMIDFLQNIGSNANLPETVTATAIKNYQDLKEKRPYKFTPRINLSAYALYCAFHDHDVPRSMEEITGLTGVACSKLWKLESRNISCLRQCSAAQIFPRYAHYFKLTHQDEKRLIRQLSTMKNDSKFQSKSTKSLCAAVILKHLKKTNKYRLLQKQFYCVFGLYPYQIMHLVNEINI